MSVNSHGVPFSLQTLSVSMRSRLSAASSRRGTATDDGPAFVVEDGRYLSARWPGDAYLFARTFIQRLP